MFEVEKYIKSAIEYIIEKKLLGIWCLLYCVHPRNISPRQGYTNLGKCPLSYWTVNFFLYIQLLMAMIVQTDSEIALANDGYLYDTSFCIWRTWTSSEHERFESQGRNANPHWYKICKFPLIYLHLMSFDN